MTDTVNRLDSATAVNPELLSERERERLAAREALQMRELQHIQLRQVQQQLPRFLVITALSVVAAVWLFWDWPYASNRTILIWAGTFLLFLMVRGTLVWWYGRRVTQNLNTLGRIITATAVLTAAFWVYAIIDFNPRIFPNSDYLADVANRQVLLAALLATLAPLLADCLGLLQALAAALAALRRTALMRLAWTF